MKRIMLLLLILPLMNACELLLFDEAKGTDDPRQNFEYLWKECDEKYSFFELKAIDWDSIYTVYQAKIQTDMTNDSLFNLLGAMLNELKDGHVNLVSYFNVSNYHVELTGPDNFDFRIVKENYLPDDYYNSGPFAHDFIAGGLIGYIRFPAFSGFVDTDNLDFVLERYQDTEGIIFDIRENGGGTPLDIYAILARFVEEETHLFDSRIKNGPGHDEFSEPEPAMVSPSDDIRYTNTVAVLTDRGSYSASSFFALSAKAIPNMVLIGDTTAGGLGMPNGGQLPNGWQYRFSVTQALDLNGNNFENGVPPDIHVLMSNNDRAYGTDPVIERAIQEILY